MIVFTFGAVVDPSSWIFIPSNNALAAGSAKSKYEPIEGTMNKSVEREFLVALNASLKASDRQSLWKKHGAEEVEKVGSTELYLVRVVDGVDMAAFRRELALEAPVRYVEPNLQLKTFPAGGAPKKSSSDR